MTVTHMDDCSMVSKVTPSCSPKKSKCTKGVNVSIETANGCTVTGKYKNTGKKQSMSGLAIDGFVTAHQQQQQCQQLPGQPQLQGRHKGANVCLISSSTGSRRSQPVIQQTLPAPACQTPPCLDKKEKPPSIPYFSV